MDTVQALADARRARAAGFALLAAAVLAAIAGVLSFHILGRHHSALAVVAGCASVALMARLEWVGLLRLNYARFARRVAGR